MANRLLNVKNETKQVHRQTQYCIQKRRTRVRVCILSCWRQCNLIIINGVRVEPRFILRYILPEIFFFLIY